MSTLKAVLLFPLLLTVWAVPSNGCQLDYRLQTFKSTGVDITIERYTPRLPHPPGVLMIHGSAGVYTRQSQDVPARDNFGEQRIACAGFDVFLVHYMEISGVRSAADEFYMRSHFSEWLGVLEDATDFVRAQNKREIAVVGESLGGYLALVLAATRRPFFAISVYSTGLPDVLDRPALSQLPPVLIQHGVNDSIIPVQSSRSLRDRLVEAQVHTEFIVWPRLGHDLNAANSAPSVRTVEFLKRIAGQGRVHAHSRNLRVRSSSTAKRPK